MKTYLFTSTHFTGHILFQFDDTGRLAKYDTADATLTDAQKDWITNRLPKTFDELQQVLKKSKGATLTMQLKTAVTFDEFWKKTCINKNSSKHKSRAIFDKMKQVDRDAAHNYWDIYLRNLEPGIGVKYVETYLRSKLWEN